MARKFLFTVLVFLELDTSPLWAGALFPDVRAASSANGKYLVVVEYEYSNPDERVKTITRVTYRVLRKQEFINDKFTTATAFWSDFWNVSMATPKAMGTPLPVISGDGQYLVLVSVDPAFSDITVLRMYRAHRYGEDLVRTYKLKDIWTADELKGHADRTVNDGRPLWFTRSTFGFTADNQQFVVRMPWGKAVHIGLRDGAIHTE